MSCSIRWYSAKRLWRAARSGGSRSPAASRATAGCGSKIRAAPEGWRWQRLSDYTAKLSASDYLQLKWPKSDEDVYVHVVTTRVRKLYSCQVVIVRQSLDAPLSQARYWASSDLQASVQSCCSRTSPHVGTSKSSLVIARKNWAFTSIN